MFGIPIESGPNPIQEAVIRILVVLVALLVIYLSRRVLTWLVLKPIKTMTKRSGRQIDERLLSAVLGPVRLVLVAIALLVSAQILLVQDDFFRGLLDTSARILLIFATLLLVYRMVDILAPSGIQLAALTGMKVEERLVPFLRVGLKFFVVAVGLVIILQEFGYDVSGLIAGIGLGGLAFSLAAQETIANLFGFVSIVGDSPFLVGDYIKTPDVEGTAEHVGLRSTRVRQLDQALITIPNSVLAGSPILNWSRTGRRRVEITVGVTYDTTAAQMRTFIERLRTMLEQWPDGDPSTVRVFFKSFGDSSLDVLMRIYVQEITWEGVMSHQERIQIAIMELVADMGLSIAFPSRSLYVENLPEVLNAFGRSSNIHSASSPREKAVSQEPHSSSE
jgi:MscS family membrane protein